jgi:hypothetical protein
MKQLEVLDTMEPAMGTSYKGKIVGYSFIELFAALGAPTMDKEANTDSFVEWCIDFKGDTFTIYDWNAGDRIWVLAENEVWNIGGKTHAGEFIEHVIGLMEKNRK